MKNNYKLQTVEFIEMDVRLDKDLEWKFTIDNYLKRNNAGYDRCYNTIITLLCIKRFSNNPSLNLIDINVIKYIAKLLWESRGTIIWTINN